MNFTACDTAAGLGRSAKEHAPTQRTLVQILQEKRSELLTELRNVEETIEAMEANPNFDAIFKRVANLIQGRIIR